MRRREFLAVGSAVVAGAAMGGGAASAAGRADRTEPAGGIEPASIIPVEPGDSADVIVAKAAAVVPRPAQVAWQRCEVTAFTHFGMNTFTDREWGSGAEDESWFHPTAVLDVDQWMQAYKAAGAKQVMLTAKHHDGFVLYPTRYTNHSVIASSWWVLSGGEAERTAAQSMRGDDPSAFWQVRRAGRLNPQGDVLGTYLAAARRAGLRVGVYLSPADGAELPHAWHAQYVQEIRAKAAAGQPLSIEEQATLEDGDRAPGGQGRYGSGSAVTARTIPTLVANDDRAEAVRSGRLPSFAVREDDYNAYYLNQLYELFTEYGPIDELWLDGANPWSGVGITEGYDFTEWFRLIHALSPQTVTFAGPQGTRWVGNEQGVARPSEWSVIPDTADPATAHGEEIIPGGAEAADIGSRAVITEPRVKFLQWFPAEADVSIRPGWFFHASEQPKSGAQLVGLYESSVGRNAVLLLNVPPGRDGRIAEADVASLGSFGEAVRATYGENLVRGGQRVAVGEELALRAAVSFDRVRLGEDIGFGQHVEQFAVDVLGVDGSWQEAVVSGTTIGYSRILALAAPVRGTAVRVRVLQARAEVRLAEVGVYRSVPAR